MSFESGTVSFRTFKVNGKGDVDNILLQLSAFKFVIGEENGAEEVEYGWIGPRHQQDFEFNHENNVFADNVHFALRIDTNKVPGSIRKAHKEMMQQAAAAENPSGFLSKSQRAEIKQTLQREFDAEVRSGKHRKTKTVAILWDIDRNNLYANVSASCQDKLVELFERSFGLELSLGNTGMLAARYAEVANLKQEYEDLRPTAFTVQADNLYPEYPWVAKGASPKDFLGNEFLVWLWYCSRQGDAIVVGGKNATVFFDRVLELECAFGKTGKQTLRGTGPAASPEAKKGLRNGKVPRKACLILDYDNDQYSFVFGAEKFSFTALKLPDPEEADAVTPRILFEERTVLIHNFLQAVGPLFSAFLTERFSSTMWVTITDSIKTWIAEEK